MKRIITIALLSIALLAIGTYSYAQGRGNGAQSGRGMNYVDENGDGKCDNIGQQGTGKGYHKGHRMRAKNGPGSTSAHGPNFVDKDGDGLCDNFKATK